ncbi:MAG: hypothetical protein IJP93_08150, partial [Bacteroidales bacterium]|nr:hypothetical protein [Bacteroidales bacterium]
RKAVLRPRKKSIVSYMDNERKRLNPTVAKTVHASQTYFSTLAVLQLDAVFADFGAVDVHRIEPGNGQ